MSGVELQRQQRRPWREAQCTLPLGNHVGLLLQRLYTFLHAIFPEPSKPCPRKCLRSRPNFCSKEVIVFAFVFRHGFSQKCGDDRSTTWLTGLATTMLAACGLMGEQGANSIHSKFNSLYKRHYMALLKG